MNNSSSTDDFHIPEDEIDSVLPVCFVDDVPQLPAQVDGRPMDLNQYNAFAMELDGGGFAFLPRDEFFRQFLPSRLYFETLCQLAPHHQLN